MKQISLLNIRYPWIITIGFIVVTAFFALQIPRTVIDPEIKSMLPKDFESRINLDQIEEIFGGNEMAMIILSTNDILDQKTLQRVKKISRKVKRLKDVDKVLSLFEQKEIKGEDGAMTVNPAVYKIPRNDLQKAELKKRLTANDLVYGSVVSKDFSSTAIIAMLKVSADDNAMMKKLRSIIEEVPGDEEAIIGGLPYIRTQIAHDIRYDLRKFMPFGLLIMLIFLFVCFRQLRGVLLPFSVVIMSIIVTMGLIPLFGWKIQMITVLLPVILLAITNDYGIHLISKYQEDNFLGSTLSPKDLARGIVVSLGKPIIITGITTIAGMLCLLSHIIVPAKQMAVLAGIGIAFALICSISFIPAVLSLLPRAKAIITYDESKKAFIEKSLDRIANFASGHPKSIIVFFLLFALLGSFGIRHIIIDTNPENYYSYESPVVKASHIANEKFGGSTSVSIIAQGDIKNPKHLSKIDLMEKEVAGMENIGQTTSIAKVVRQMSKALNDPDGPGYDKIPETRNAVAQYFELYYMSGDPDDFEKLVDFPYQNAQIIARINEISSTKIKEIVTTLEKRIENDPLFVKVGGFGSIFSEITGELVKGQLLSLILSLLIISVLVGLLFRSVTAGLMGAMPIALSLIFLFGLMGYLGIELNAPTSLLSSIMIGVGIDYTIHFLWRYRIEHGINPDPVKAVKNTLTTSGRGITFNALSVIIGFVVLFLSNFMPIRFFGILIIVSISSCLLAALVLLPSLCIVIRPKFLEPKSVNQGPSS